MKIDSLPEILSSSDFDPVNDKILVEQNGKTFYTTLFDIQSILNTRARPSEKTSWKFLEKNNVIESPISKISLSDKYLTSVGQPETMSLSDPLEINSQGSFNVKIADLQSGVPAGVRRVLIKLIAENVRIQIKWRQSFEFSLDIPGGEKHVSIFPMENIQNIPTTKETTIWQYNSHNIPGNLNTGPWSSMADVDLPYENQVFGNSTSNVSPAATFAMNDLFSRDPNRHKEVGPLTLTGLTPTGPESSNLDSIDNTSVSLSPFPSNNIGKIYSFQVIAYSNFG